MNPGHPLVFSSCPSFGSGDELVHLCTHQGPPERRWVAQGWLVLEADRHSLAWLGWWILASEGRVGDVHGWVDVGGLHDGLHLLCTAGELLPNPWLC